MEIGLSNEQLIDVGLNAAGFLIAGMLLMLIRSFFSGKTPRPKPAVAADIQTAAARTPEPETKKAEPVGPEFVSFSNMAGSSSHKNIATDGKHDSKIRNRQEIIRMAKKVLSGDGGSGSTESLPITDGELAMIKQRLNLQGAGRNK